MRFDFESLRQRKVVPWGVGYLGAAWLVLQVYDVFKEPLGLSNSTFIILVILLIGGLPVTVLLAWFHGERGRQRFSGTEAIILGIVLAGVGVLVSFVDRGPDEAAAAVDAVEPGKTTARRLDRSSIAVLPFAIRGSAPPDLSEGIASLLSSRLDGAGDITTPDPNAVFLKSETARLDEAAPAIAASLNAGSYVTGEAVLVGDRLNVRASLYHTTEKREIMRAGAEGRVDSVFALVDSLAVSLLAAGYGARTTRSQGGVLPTRSLPALRLYLEGERNLRNGRHEAAADAFEEAAAVDTLFALALYRLSVAASWVGNRERRQSALARTDRFRDRLPARHKMLLAAGTAYAQEQFDEAETLFRTITERYPEEREAWVGLGEVLYHGNPARGRRSAEARVPLQRGLQLNPAQFYEPLLHLINLAAEENRPLEVDSSVLLLANQTPAFGVLLPLVHATITGDAQQVTALLDQLSAQPPRDALETLLTVAVTPRADLGRMAAVARVIAERESAPEIAALGWLRVAQFEAGRGRLHAAARALDRAVALQPAMNLQRAIFYGSAAGVVPFPDGYLEEARDALGETGGPVMAQARQHFFTGLLSYHRGDRDALSSHMRAIRRFRSEASADTSQLGQYVHVLQALNYSLENRPAEALREFMLEAPHMAAPPRITRALLHARSGDKRAAQRWLAAASDGALQPLPAYIQYRYALISDDLGDRAAAIDAYAWFLLPMDSADAELAPMVSHARARLAALSQSSR